ncbi:TraR/DksA family transcriptional regulator [Oceanospirillum maris]|jgi:RNA polymerase-binding transcription factor DksA|uniref:TraR/DksA family transcriptional regulator n=1 Tax=Oceanospirillum maris TaxID=64977 RepID=UPI0004222444|nr:TraR/DksA family transcriptional regulator [Oceanospirillum maris]
MDIQAIKDKLTHELDVLNARLKHVEKDVAQAHSSDFQEQAQERENDEVLDEIGNETLHSIEQIKFALMRIDTGEYGVCANCGDDIAKERLLILPESTLCVKCAD